MGPNKRSHGIQFRAETVQLFKNLHCIIKPKLNNAKPLVILLNKPKNKRLYRSTTQNRFELHFF